jgi:hypothetical protein
MLERMTKGNSHLIVQKKKNKKRKKKKQRGTYEINIGNMCTRKCQVEQGKAKKINI